MLKNGNYLDERHIGAINEASSQYSRSLERLGFENQIGEFVLSESAIELIHNEMCYKYGGAIEIRDLALFHSVCQAPYQSVFGKDLYPSVFDKAAKYLFDFSRYQIFLDGNKRTGLATAVAFLIGNGYKLTLTQMQMYELTMAVAIGRIAEISELSQILHDNADLGRFVPIDDSYSKENKMQEENELDLD